MKARIRFTQEYSSCTLYVVVCGPRMQQLSYVDEIQYILSQLVESVHNMQIFFF